MLRLSRCCALVDVVGDRALGGMTADVLASVVTEKGGHDVGERSAAPWQRTLVMMGSLSTSRFCESIDSGGAAGASHRSWLDASAHLSLTRQAVSPPCTRSFVHALLHQCSAAHARVLRRPLRALLPSPAATACVPCCSRVRLHVRPLVSVLVSSLRCCPTLPCRARAPLLPRSYATAPGCTYSVLYLHVGVQAAIPVGHPGYERPPVPQHLQQPRQAASPPSLPHCPRLFGFVTVNSPALQTSS